jgi:hypothetical protein
MSISWLSVSSATVNMGINGPFCMLVVKPLNEKMRFQQASLGSCLQGLIAVW